MAETKINSSSPTENNTTTRSTTNNKKMLNPKAQEFRPKPTTPPDSFDVINIIHPPMFVFHPPPHVFLRYAYAEPVKPLYRGGGATLVDITDEELEANNRAVQKRSLLLMKKKKQQLVKRQKWAPPRQEKARCPSRFHRRLVDLRPRKAAWKPKGPISQNTTVMIKNIPNNLRRDFMLKFMDQYCKEYSLEYDFFYLPMDFGTGDNLGYGFVNFTSAACASGFKNLLHGLKWTSICDEGGPMTSRKICNITWARIQGKAALVERFSGSFFACKCPDYLPVLLNPPRDGSDPNPPPPVVIGRCYRS